MDRLQVSNHNDLNQNARSEHIGRLQGRSPAVDFIDQRLPDHDPAFLNSHSVFDKASGEYIALIRAQHHESTADPADATAVASSPQADLGHVGIPDQISHHVEAQSMKFWDDTFPEAMQVLLIGSTEPPSLAKSGAGIRNASSWDEVWARLSDAQVKYMEGEGTTGKLKRMRRKVADNLCQPAVHIAKMIPDVDPWTTPVTGTVGILLHAIETAAKTRQEVMTSLSNLDKMFQNIDSFAATFPTDPHVRQASVSLVVAILQAVEHVMVFFTKSAAQKSAAAILKGSDYQKELFNSFNEVQKRSDYLIQKAQNSHYESTRAAIQDILSREDRLLTGQAHIAQQSADMKNTIFRLMEVYVRDRELDRQEHQEELRRRDEIQKQQDAIYARRHQEILALVHQFQIPSLPVSPSPAPSVLPPPLPPTTYSAIIPVYPTWTAQTVSQRLGVPDISTWDLQKVKDLGCTLSQKDKKKADQVLQTGCFTQWMRSLQPTKLLIHGVFRGRRTVSPLSLLTAKLTEAVRADQLRFVSLVFFCGCHVDREEDKFSGGRALIQVLISQLLQQQPHMNISPFPWELSMDRVHQGDLQQLCQLLNFLVHHLPGQITLFCIVDGMVYYERDEFIDEMHYVLTEIMRLVGDPTIQANVKLLITSPWRTEMTQQFFQEDREILHMEGMPSMELTPSASRVIRRHISHTESDQFSRDSSPGP